MFHCIKWQHIFDNNIVPASNDGTMKQLFMVFHREHNTHMLCEMEIFTNIWPRLPQQDLIMPPIIRLHRHPQSHNFCKIFYQTSSVMTCRNHISFLITPATIWSPVYPNLWTCLVTDSGLFIFLTQILICSYSCCTFPALLSMDPG